MTSEQRLDRLERIAKLFASAGFRARHDVREIDEKLNILINTQIRTDEKFARLAESHARLVDSHVRLAEAQALSDRKLADSHARLAEAQALTDQKLADLADAQALSDRKLAELIDIIRKGRNGNRSARNN